MERFWHNRTLRIMAYVLFGLAIIIMLQHVSPILSWIYGVAKAVLAPFLIAMIISYVLNPIVNVLHSRKVPRTVAVLLIYASFIVSLTVLFMNMTPMFMEQLRELNEHMPELTMRAQNLVNGIHESKALPDSVRDGIQQSLAGMERAVSQSISGFINRIGSTINTLFLAFIVPFLAFYMMKDFQLIERSALTFVPKSKRKEIVTLLKDIDNALGNYIRGQLLVCVIVGALAYVGYMIIDAPYPLLLASIVAVFNIIPYLGPFFGAAPAIVMASTVSFKLVLMVIAVNLIVQVLEGNVVSPQVVGRTLHMHPLLIIFAVLVGGELAGIPGLILAVPLFAVMKVIIQHVTSYYSRNRTA
ncbi:UPF0118 membrane protein YrrI [Xylanibacillus composti]|uniref:UPF0118 membrane protein YrrI n=1 Tax=Xylanibacillus composti TaxID=1572762 RepID=A0A8J4H7R7_9BACL|nr:AI-2E family transporter [Xylanibacillus composti]GIQ70113.1 UPF0118 membrane protein YrrI [Xylanibacillus composti]